MLFYTKKLISAFLLPLPFSLLWMLLGILFILTQTDRLRNICFIIGFVILSVFSFNPVATALLNHLQNQYAPLINPPADATEIVVLGGGVSGGKNYPPNLTLGTASLSRLVEGIRLFKLIQKNHPDAKLILSGGRVFLAPSVAGKMKNTAVMLGVDEKNIILENGSEDTHQEALYLQKIIGNARFILVTSAYHMPRSMDLFQAQGMHPIAGPTQFLGYRDESTLWYIPTTSALILSDIAIHEYLGILWAKWQGYIK